MTTHTEERYEPEYLDRWTQPRDYAGQQWDSYYSAGVGRHRDSEPLERANFRAMLNRLGFDAAENEPDNCPSVPLDSPNGMENEPTRVIVRESHWAVGWVEWIAIHESDSEGLRIADLAKEKLEEYPILDESLYSEIEDDDCEQVWMNCYRPKERLEYLRKRMSDYYLGKPGTFHRIREAVRGSWHEAANLLPSPSDILR